MESWTSIEPMHTYHLNLLASNLDSSNVRMSPSCTLAPSYCMHGEVVTVIQEFNANLCTPLLVPDTPTPLAALPVGASWTGPFTVAYDGVVKHVHPVEFDANLQYPTPFQLHLPVRASTQVE